MKNKAQQEFNYQAYSMLLNLLFSEELERLGEYLYSVNNNYDCSEEKYWIHTPNQDLPSYEEMEKIMKTYNSTVSVDDINEEQAEAIKAIWYSKHFVK